MRKLIHKLKWKFHQSYQHLFYWLEWCYSDERHDPYRCCDCGSTDVEIKIWSKVNEGGRPNGDCEEYECCFCNNCDGNVRIRPTSYLLAEAEQWWGGTDFRTMEYLTGCRQGDFDSEDGCQDFVDACNSWWNALSTEEKIRLWRNN